MTPREWNPMGEGETFYFGAPYDLRLSGRFAMVVDGQHVVELEEYSLRHRTVGIQLTALDNNCAIFPWQMYIPTPEPAWEFEELPLPDELVEEPQFAQFRAWAEQLGLIEPQDEIFDEEVDYDEDPEYELDVESLEDEETADGDAVDADVLEERPRVLEELLQEGHVLEDAPARDAASAAEVEPQGNT